MRTSDSLSAIEARLAGLVHDTALSDPIELSRHKRFIASRMVAGCVALASLPPYLLWRGAPSPVEQVAIVCLVMPILAALLLSRTGRWALAHGASSLSLAGLIVSIAAVSGGVGSAATVWLVAVPLEALLSGSRKAAVAASAVAIGAVLLIAGLDHAGVLPPQPTWPIGLAMPVFAVTAIAHATALAFEHSRREAQRRALASERDARDRSLLQVIDDLVSWHDSNGQVLRASAGAAKLLGVPDTALTGRALLARVHVSDRPAFLKAISDAAASERPVAVQFRLHVGPERGAVPGPGDVDARVIWAETRAHRVEAAGPGHGDCAVVAVTRDISDHKRHAEDLERAKAEAERADLSKGRFLATVSHELRTPLNAIIGFSELLTADGPFAMGAERRREYAQIIHSSGEHLLEVVNTLLDMSKIETGNFDFVPEGFDVATLVGSCCDLMQLKADQAGVRLGRDVANELPEIVADARACRQILINLVSNAIKFTPRGGSVTVAAWRDGERLKLAVSDTGIGIGETDLPRLGDPFFQAGSSYARSHEGTGLGLSVVRGLVGLHHGELSVESALGEGTVVTVALPIGGRASAQPAGPIRVATSARPSNLAVLRARS